MDTVSVALVPLPLKKYQDIVVKVNKGLFFFKQENKILKIIFREPGGETTNLNRCKKNQFAHLPFHPPGVRKIWKVSLVTYEKFGWMSLAWLGASKKHLWTVKIPDEFTTFH